MVHNSANEIRQENMDRNIITKVDSNEYHEDDNLEDVVDYRDMYDLENLNLEENVIEYHKECHKCKFLRELKYIFDMNDIHEHEVNNIAECDLLHDILNTS